MSTNPKPQHTNPAPKTAPASAKPAAKKTEPLLFDKQNYLWMIAGVVLVFIGFQLMKGGKTPDPHQFNYDEIYSFRRITVAPIVILIGFAIEVYAIMKKPKETTVS